MYGCKLASNEQLCCKIQHTHSPWQVVTVLGHHPVAVVSAAHLEHAANAALKQSVMLHLELLSDSANADTNWFVC